MTFNDDLWYAPCDADRHDAKDFDMFLKQYRSEEIYTVNLYEGDFEFNETKKVVRVLDRRKHGGKNFEAQVYDKLNVDSDVMYILKCAKMLGYTFILEEKFSN